jgi:hypothetical protein
MRVFFIFLALLAISCQSRTTKDNFVKFEYDGNIKIVAFINDSVKGLFILDTGADGLYLDSSFVSDNKSLIKSADTAIISGEGNSGDRKVIIIINPLTASIGNQKMIFDTIPILQLERINNQKISGIIGNDFLKHGVLTINNTDTTLSIDTLIDFNDYQTSIPFEFSNDRIYLTARVVLSNRKVIDPKLLLDIGCPDVLILNTAFFGKFKSNVTNLIEYSVLDGGVSGNTNGGEFRVNQIDVGNITIDSPIICFSMDTTGSHASLKYDGLLGNGFLERFNYSIDYENKTLYFNRNKKFNKPFKSTVSGMYLIKLNDIAIVKCIYKQFEPFKQGLNIGDTVIKINDSSISDLVQKQINDLLDIENKSLKIVFKHGVKLKTIEYKTVKKI